MNYGDQRDTAPQTELFFVKTPEAACRLGEQESEQLADALDLKTASQIADVLRADDRLLDKLVGS